MSINDDLKEAAQRLRQERDELEVKMHLASMEVKDEWEGLEKKWQEYSSKSKNVMEEVEPALEDIQAALSLLGEELQAGYKRIRKAL